MSGISTDLENKLRSRSRRYNAPRLTIYGDMREYTAGGGTGTNEGQSGTPTQQFKPVGGPSGG
jgi:hypothetical protein